MTKIRTILVIFVNFANKNLLINERLNNEATWCFYQYCKKFKYPGYFLCLMIGICLSNPVLQLIVQIFGEKQIIIFLDGMQIVELVLL